MKKITDPRHQARRLALAYLYGYLISKKPQEKKELKKILKIDKYDKDIFNLLSTNYIKHKDKLEKLSKRYLNTWPKDQLLEIDVIIINLAILESILLKKAPYKVCVDEAVELAKEFSTEKSGKFVNGVLANLIKEKIIKQNG